MKTVKRRDVDSITLRSGKGPYIHTHAQNKLFNKVSVPFCLNCIINSKGEQEQRRNVISLICCNWSCLLDNQCTRLITWSQIVTWFILVCILPAYIVDWMFVVCESLVIKNVKLEHIKDSLCVTSYHVFSKRTRRNCFSVKWRLLKYFTESFITLV